MGYERFRFYCDEVVMAPLFEIEALIHFQKFYVLQVELVWCNTLHTILRYLVVLKIPENFRDIQERHVSSGQLTRIKIVLLASSNYAGIDIQILVFPLSPS